MLLAQMNQLLPNERRIAMRIGINLGDVIAEGGDVFGDGVNIAARIEALAEPGSIYVSGIVHDQIVDRIDFDFEDLGPKELKNIRRPIHVYRMGGETADEPEEFEAGRAQLDAAQSAKVSMTIARSRCCRSTISAAIPSRNFSPTASPKTSSRCSPAGAPFR